MPPGTPLIHSVQLGSYRYGFLIESVRETAALSPDMTALHRTLALLGMPMVDMAGMAVGTRADLSKGPVLAASGLSPQQDLAIAFALLLVLVPRLPRPSLPSTRAIVIASEARSQWTGPLLLSPPRV